MLGNMPPGVRSRIWWGQHLRMGVRVRKVEAEVTQSVKRFQGQAGNLQDSPQGQHGVGTGQDHGVGQRSAYLEIVIKSKCVLT